MSSVPKGRADRLDFYEQHVDGWVENADAIGVPADLASAIAGQTAAARQAYSEQQQALQAARAATLRFNLAVNDMRKTGSAVLAHIEAWASQNGNQVYSAASISPPKKRSPLGPPGMPHGFAFSLDQIGSLQLTWECDNPNGARGTTYYVARRLSMSGAFATIGVTGERRFVDASLPRGLAVVEYEVRGVRGASQGPAAQYMVNFGTGMTSRFGPRGAAA